MYVYHNREDAIGIYWVNFNDAVKHRLFPRIAFNDKWAVLLIQNIKMSNILDIILCGC